MKKLYKIALILIVFSLLFPATRIFSQGETIVFDETITWEWPIPKWYGGSGFYWWHRSLEGVNVVNYGDMPADNWVSPIDYSNATLYLYFEVVDQPTNEPFKIQLGIWQDKYLNEEHRETVSAQKSVAGGDGSSINVSLGKPSSWWNIPTAPGPVDFTRPEDFYRIGIILWTLNNCVPINDSWNSPVACVDSEVQAAKFFPMKAKVKVTAVYSSGTTDYLNVTPTEKTLSSSSGSALFSVSSNVNWTVSENSSWLTAVKTNSTTLTVNYDANSGTTRQATVTVSGPDVSSKTITLTQSGSSDYLEVTPLSKTVTKDAGSTTFAVSSSVNWSVSESSSWLSAVKTNSTTLTVNYNANSGSERQASVTLSGTGVNSKSVSLTQAANCTLAPNPVVTASDGESCEYVNVTWPVVTGATGYKIYKNDAFVISVTENSWKDYNASQTPASYKVTSENSCGSSSGASDNGHLATPPVIEIGNDVQTNAGVPVTINAPAGFESYTWSNGITASSASFTFATAGVYKIGVTVADVNQCSATDSLNITVNQIPSSLQDNKSIGFRIYPNPSSGRIFLLSETRQKCELKINNSAGITVFSKSIMPETNTIEIDTDLAPGVYFVTIFTQEGIINEKVIIK